MREQKAAAVGVVARAPQQPIRAQKLYLHLSKWFMLFSCGVSVIQKNSSGDFKELLRPPRQYLLADLVGLPSPTPPPTQAQYILIHQALLEHTQFGETENALQELHSTLNTLKQRSADNEPTLLEDEFEV